MTPSTAAIFDSLIQLEINIGDISLMTLSKVLPLPSFMVNGDQSFSVSVELTESINLTDHLSFVNFNTLTGQPEMFFDDELELFEIDQPVSTKVELDLLIAKFKQSGWAVKLDENGYKAFLSHIDLDNTHYLSAKKIDKPVDPQINSLFFSFSFAFIIVLGVYFINISIDVEAMPPTNVFFALLLSIIATTGLIQLILWFLFTMVAGSNILALKDK